MNKDSNLMKQNEKPLKFCFIYNVTEKKIIKCINRNGRHNYVINYLFSGKTKKKNIDK